MGKMGEGEKWEKEVWRKKRHLVVRCNQLTLLPIISHFHPTQAEDAETGLLTEVVAAALGQKKTFSKHEDCRIT